MEVWVSRGGLGIRWPTGQLPFNPMLVLVATAKPASSTQPSSTQAKPKQATNQASKQRTSQPASQPTNQPTNAAEVQSHPKKPPLPTQFKQLVGTGLALLSASSSKGWSSAKFTQDRFKRICRLVCGRQTAFLTNVGSQNIGTGVTTTAKAVCLLFLQTTRLLSPRQPQWRNTMFQFPICTCARCRRLDHSHVPPHMKRN